MPISTDPAARGGSAHQGIHDEPDLMWKAGLTDYAEFAQRLLERITEQPISFEVFADDESEIRRQAR